MYVLALTGGLGSGKSTAAEVFAERGAVVIDLDDVAKTLLEQAPAVRDRVIEEFGPEVRADDGAVDRAALARLAFVLVVPLLAESPLFLEPVDAVLAISADEETRIGRVLARGMQREDAENRLARQAGDAERREIADYVIDNEGSLEEFRAIVAEFWDAEIAPRGR
jgi:dephospho-CoA kinase